MIGSIDSNSIGQKDADAAAFQAILQAELIEEQEKEKLIASLSGQNPQDTQAGNFGQPDSQLSS